MEPCLYPQLGVSYQGRDATVTGARVCRERFKTDTNANEVREWDRNSRRGCDSALDEFVPGVPLPLGDSTGQTLWFFSSWRVSSPPFNLSRFHSPRLQPHSHSLSSLTSPFFHPGLKTRTFLLRSPIFGVSIHPLSRRSDTEICPVALGDRCPLCRLHFPAVNAYVHECHSETPALGSLPTHVAPSTSRQPSP